MNWTEIEAKWAAMTRRVQSDQSPEISELASTPAPSLAPNDAEPQRKTPVPLDRSAT